MRTAARSVIRVHRVYRKLELEDGTEAAESNEQFREIHDAEVNLRFDLPRQQVLESAHVLGRPQ